MTWLDRRARVGGQFEGAPLLLQQKSRYPGFADDETQTDRVIPVVMLDPR